MPLNTLEDSLLGKEGIFDKYKETKDSNLFYDSLSKALKKYIQETAYLKSEEKEKIFLYTTEGIDGKIYRIKPRSINKKKKIIVHPLYHRKNHNHPTTAVQILNEITSKKMEPGTSNLKFTKPLGLNGSCSGRVRLTQLGVITNREVYHPILKIDSEKSEILEEIMNNS